MKIRIITLSFFICFCSFVKSFGQRIVPFLNGKKWSYFDTKSEKEVLENLEAALPFRSQVGIAAKERKWGVVDATMKVLIPFKNDEIKFLTEDYLLVKNKREVRVFDVGRSKFRKGAYREVSPVKGRSDYFVFADEQGLFGLMDSTFRVTVPAQHQEAPRVLFDDIMVFSKLVKGRLVSSAFHVEGKQIIPFRFREIQSIGKKYLIGNIAGGKMMIFSLDGNKVFTGPRSEYTRINNRFVVLQAGRGYSVYSRKTDKLIVAGMRDVNMLTSSDEIAGLNLKGQAVVFSPEDEAIIIKGAEKIGYFRQGYVNIEVPDGKNRSLKGVVDNRGQQILAPEYYSLHSWNENYVACGKNYNQVGLLDIRSGEEIMPFEYESIQVLKSGYVLAKKPREHYRMYDEGLHLVPDVQLSRMTNQAASTKGKNLVVEVPRENQYIPKVGILTDTGEWLLPPEYTEVKTIKNRYGDDALPDKFVFRAHFEDGPRAGVMRADGTLMIPGGKYYWLRYYGGRHFTAGSNEKIRVEIRGTQGVVDTLGNEIVPAIYEEIKEIDSNGITIQNNGKTGYYTLDGTLVLEPAYDSVKAMGGFLIVKKWGKKRVVGMNGEMITNKEYDEIKYDTNDLGLLYVQEGKQNFYIDTNGRELKK